MIKIRENINCPICETKVDNVLYEMKEYPLTELFYDKSSPIEFDLIKADQSFCFCSKCNHGFLKNIIPPEYLYQKSNYNTVSSTSKGALISLDNFASFIKRSKSYDNNFVVDMGGNDSNLLTDINAKKGIIVDPNAKSENPEYIAINEFFERIDPKSLSRDCETKATIVSSHTLEHIESPNVFFNFLSKIEGAQSIFLQFPCLELMAESGRFDLLHHQHIHYYTLSSIKEISRKYSFEVTNHEYDHDHYGTLRVELKRASGLVEGDKFNRYDNYCKTEKLYILLTKFKEMIICQNKLLEDMDDIYCYGASLMLPIIYYYFPILKRSKGILDMDQSKENLRYANITTPIIHDNINKSLKENTIFLTAVATRTANRVILKNLVNRNPLYIINPFQTF